MKHIRLLVWKMKYYLKKVTPHSWYFSDELGLQVGDELQKKNVEHLFCIVKYGIL